MSSYQRFLRVAIDRILGLFSLEVVDSIVSSNGYYYGPFRVFVKSVAVAGPFRWFFRNGNLYHELVDYYESDLFIFYGARDVRRMGTVLTGNV